MQVVFVDLCIVIFFCVEQFIFDRVEYNGGNNLVFVFQCD